MSITEVLALLTFGLACFLAGYRLGKDNHKTQK